MVPKLSWISEVSTKFTKQISSMQHGYFSDNPWFVFNSQIMLKSICKEVLSPHHVSLVIYNFKFQYDAEYNHN